MMKYIKYTLAGIIFITIFMIMAGMLIGKLYENEVKEFVLEEINKKLIVSLSIKSIGFSVIEQFPYASLKFHDVYMHELTKDNGKTKELFSCKELYLNFNVLRILKNEYEIQQMVLKEGKIKLRVNRNGNLNYIIWKSSPEEDHQDISFNLKNIKLQHFEFSYINRKDNYDFLCEINNAGISGTFDTIMYRTNIQGDLNIKHFRVNKTNYLTQNNIKIMSEVEIDHAKNKMFFKKGEATISNIPFFVNGSFTFRPKVNYCNVNIRCKAVNIQSLIDLLPKEHQLYFDDITYKGDVFFKTNISGELSSKSVPLIKTDYHLENGELMIKSKSVKLEQIKFDGKFTNGEYRELKTSSISINDFSAILNGKPLAAEINIKNMKELFLDINSNGEINLNDFQQILLTDNIKVNNGFANFNLHIKGNASAFKDYKKSGNVLLTGEVILHDACFTIPDNSYDFNDFNGKFIINEKNVEISDFTGNINGTDFELDGNLKNVIPYLTEDDQLLYIEAKCKSDKVDLNRLLGTGKTTDDTVYRISFLPHLYCNLDLMWKELVFRKFIAKDVEGKVLVRNQSLYTSNLTFGAMNGQVYSKGGVDISKTDSVAVYLDTRCVNIDITQLFDQCENFGQNYLGEKHIKGTVTADIKFASKWMPDLTADLNKVYVSGDLTIEKGELINFDPLLALSSYLKVDDIKHVKFSTLQNHVEIKDQKIYIPEMHVNSNALNLNVSGIHTFDNMVDYDISVQLSELLSKKWKLNFKDKQSEFGTIKEDDKGRTTLFLKMKGRADEPEFSYHKSRMRKALKKDIAEEQLEVKEILKKELSTIFKKDTSLNNKASEELEIEWEEDN